MMGSHDQTLTLLLTNDTGLGAGSFEIEVNTSPCRTS